MVPNIRLNNGATIPQIGLGLWQVNNQTLFSRAFDAAVEVGYRHFDTAQAYGNERMLGDAWTGSGLSRDKFYITTKISVTRFGASLTHASFKQSLDKLQTDYIDLLLLHFPVTILRKKAWLALEKILTEGGARSIGVSNYTVRHLEEMQVYAKIVPAVNQVELHVFLQQPELIHYCREHGIAVEAYSPLAHAQIMDNPIVIAIAQKHKKSYAQIMLRWLIEKQLVVIPKSITPERIKENFSVFDFALDREDMEQIETLDQELRTCWSPVHVP